MLVVHKYGGTSVANMDRIRAVSDRVAATVEKYRGPMMVVVVSAMSGFTDDYLERGRYLSQDPDPRSMDVLLSSGEQISASLLSISLNGMGIRSVALTGGQAGILTDGNHTRAKILRVDTCALLSLLALGFVAVVAGFQGLDESGCITTLGRGGSDLTAIALAGALGADLCEIYSDVDGVYTADPRIESKAMKIDALSYDEMLELSSMGAKVLLARSVELAKKLGVAFYARSSFDEGVGTLITSEDMIMERPVLSAVTLDKDRVRVSLSGVDGGPGAVAELFSDLSSLDASLDMIVQVPSSDSKFNLDFTLSRSDITRVSPLLDSFRSRLDNISVDSDVAIISVVGVGMKSNVGLAARAFAALARHDIAVMMTSTSPIRVSVLVHVGDAELGVRALHKEYHLDVQS